MTGIGLLGHIMYLTNLLKECQAWQLAITQAFLLDLSHEQPVKTRRAFGSTPAVVVM